MILNKGVGAVKIICLLLQLMYVIYKDFNSVETLNKIKSVLKQWSKRKLTRFWRVTIIKSLALSKFVPMFLSSPNPPAELIKKLEVVFFFTFYGMQDLIDTKKRAIKIIFSGLLTPHIYSFQNILVEVNKSTSK